MAGIHGSYGLMLDLGDQVTDAQLETLYRAIWALPEVQGPERTLMQFRTIPRAAEGQLHLGEGLSSGMYTRFESETLGYPPGWQVPTLLHLSAHGFADSLSDNVPLQAWLEKTARALYRRFPYRMALAGDLTTYYVNAEFVSADWMDLQATHALFMILPKSHPFTAAHKGEGKGKWITYRPQHFQQFASQDTEQQRYQRFKQSLGKALHTPKIQLSWE